MKHILIAMAAMCLPVLVVLRLRRRLSACTLKRFCRADLAQKRPARMPCVAHSVVHRMLVSPSRTPSRPSRNRIPPPDVSAPGSGYC